MSDREHRARVATAYLEEIERFVDVALRYCEVIEEWERAGHPPAFPDLFFEIEALLPQIYAAAIRLPPYGAWFEEDASTPQVIPKREVLSRLSDAVRARRTGVVRVDELVNSLMHALNDQLKGWAYYHMVHLPYGDDTEQIPHGLGDDLRDVYRWLRSGLAHLATGRGYPETRLFNAGFQWRYEFDSFVGVDIVKSLVALYYVLRYMPERMRD